jgi:hypothetical protein
VSAYKGDTVQLNYALGYYLAGYHSPHLYAWNRLTRKPRLQLDNLHNYLPPLHSQIYSCLLLALLFPRYYLCAVDYRPFQGRCREIGDHSRRRNLWSDHCFSRLVERNGRFDGALEQLFCRSRKLCLCIYPFPLRFISNSGLFFLL